MGTPPASVRNLARRLLAVEAANCSATDPHGHEAVRVCEKLRISLVRLTGTDGFAALLRRSLALARAEVPALERVTVNADCSMLGLEELAADTTDGGVDGPVRSLPICLECWPRLLANLSLSVWCATPGPMLHSTNNSRKGKRQLSTGIGGLDAMLGGGIPEGDSMLLAGPSGSGKSTLGMQFIAESLS